MNTLDEAAVRINELFESLQRAGFTEEQALTLTAATLRAGFEGQANQ